MATTFFFRDAASDLDGIHPSEIDKSLSLSRGSATATASTLTSAGPIGQRTVGSTITVTDGGTRIYSFISNPLDAVTISGAITINLRGRETNAMANASMTARVDRISNTGTFISTIGAYLTDTNAEMSTVDAAINWNPAVTSRTLVAGDRIALLVDIDDGAGVTMASGWSTAFTYDGPTGGAAGDSFVTFTETITEQGAGGEPPAPPDGVYRYSRLRPGRIHV